MNIQAIKTHKIRVDDKIQDILDQYVKDLVEEDIVIITSKIISIIQGQLIEKNKIDKIELIYQEADLILESDKNPHNICLTIKNGILIPSSGIDESNVDSMYVLYPVNIQKTIIEIWSYLRKKHQLKNLGVVVTDSHTTIMRTGVTGIALGWCGFEPLYSYIGKPDIYNQSLKVTKVNILDSLATSAVFVMGEGNEQTPLAIIKNAPKISFLDRVPTKEEQQSILIPMEEDLYGPLLHAARWRKMP